MGVRPQAFLRSREVFIEPRGREGRGEHIMRLTPKEAIDLAQQLLSYAEMVIPDEVSRVTMPHYLSVSHAALCLLVRLQEHMDGQQ